MRLVPRQLQIHCLTGDVPYFGGRFTPAQAYAASHPQPVATGAPAGSEPGVVGIHGPRGVVLPGTHAPAQSPDRGPIPGVPAAVPQAAPLKVPSTLQPTQAPTVLAAATAQPTSGGAPSGPPGAPAPAAQPWPESQRAIQQLLLAGVITAAEADQISGRLPQ